MKKPVHLISEPRECVALRTACGRALSPKVRRSESAKAVTCRNCTSMTRETGGAWCGLEGYSWRKRKPGEVDRDLTKAAAKAIAPGAFVSPVVAPGRRATATVDVRVTVDRSGLDSLNRMVKAAGVVLDVVESIENRAMVADALVTPTLREATERELAQIWRAAKTIAGTALPELRVDANLKRKARRPSR